MSIDTHADGSDAPLQFLEQARANQARLVGALQPDYDFVVCGAGSSGSVVARRLAENPDVSVLLVEAGGDDDVPSVTQPGQWPANIGTERDWGFQSQPNFRAERPLDSILDGQGAGRRIEHQPDGLGPRAPQRLGPVRRRGGRSGVELRVRAGDLPPHRRLARRSRPRSTEASVGPSSCNPLRYPIRWRLPRWTVARSVGIATFESPNGAMMETASGAALTDLRIRDGQRESVFRSYVFPYLDRPNLTVLTWHTSTGSPSREDAPAVSRSSTRAAPATSGRGTKWCCRSARSTHRRCSCCPASATKRSSSGTEFQCCNIFRASVGTSRTTSRSTASGSTRLACHPATACPRPPCSGIARDIKTLLTCSPARGRYRIAHRRMRPDSVCPTPAGPCGARSRSRRAAAACI